MEKLRIGIVGLNRGRAHVIQVRKCTDAELVAVCDLDHEKADRIAEEFYIKKKYYDYRELLADEEVDAVIMATPIDIHAETVIAALEAGKHVLSEVIVATTLDDCKRIGDAAAESGKKYMMAENYCYIRPLLIVEELAGQGLFGEIYYAESDYLKDFQEYHPNFPDIGGWRQKTYFGRRGHPYITHTLGPLCHIMNEKITKVGSMAAGRNFDMVADNTCGLLLETDKKHVIRLRSSFVSPRPDNVTYYCFEGTNGCYQAPQGPTDFHKVYIRGICRPGEWKNVYEFKDYCSERWKKYWNTNDYAEDALDNDTYELYDSGLRMMLEDFIDCVLHDKKVPVSFADAANWTAAGLLSGESVEAGSRVLDVPVYREYED